MNKILKRIALAEDEEQIIQDFFNKYIDENNQLNPAGKKLLLDLIQGIKRYLLKNKSFLTKETLEKPNFSLDSLFFADDMQEIYDAYTNEKFFHTDIYFNLFEHACELIQKNNIDYLYKLVNTDISKIHQLSTAASVFNFFEKDKDAITDFIKLYIKQCTTFLRRLRQLTNNTKIEINIQQLIDKHILDLDDENIRLINKFIMPMIQSSYDIISPAEFNLSNLEFHKLINNYTNINEIENIIQKYIQQYNTNIDKRQISDIAELPYTKIKIGESINLNEFVYDSYHKLTVVPIVYINGNFIKGDNALYVNNLKTINEKVRQYHIQLIQKYCFNENLHINDIIKKPMEFWKSADKESLCGMGEQKYPDISVGEGILYQDTCMISYIPYNNKVNEVITAFKTYHPEQLYRQNDSFTQATRLARKNITKLLRLA